MKSVSNRKNRWSALLAVCLIACTSVTWGQPPTPAPAATVPPTPAGTAKDKKVEVEPKPLEVIPIEETPVEEMFVETPVYYGEPLQVVTGPQWTASAGATFLTRDKGDKTILVKRGAFDNNGIPLLNTRDIDFQYKTGYNVDVTRHFDVFDLHFNHFAVDGWNSTGGFVGAPLSFSNTFPGFLGSGVNVSSFNYNSEIASAEANVRMRTDSIITPFTGFRWVQLNEKMVMSDDLAGPPGFLTPLFTSETQNDLYGLQVGADILLYNSSRFQFTGTGKIAIAGNSARNRLTATPAAQAVAGPFTPQVGSGSTNVAFVYDMALKGKLQISEHVAISGGYSVMFLSQVALAPGQLQQNQLLLPPPAFPAVGITAPGNGVALDTGDFLLIHGGQINLEVTW